MGANPFSAAFTETAAPPTASELAAAMRTGLERRCLFPPGNRRGELHYYANTLGNPISVKPTAYARIVHLLRQAFKVLLRPWLEMQTRFNQSAIEALDRLHANLYALQNKVASLETASVNPDLGRVGTFAPDAVDLHAPAAVSDRILEHLFVQTRLPDPPARLLDLGCADRTNSLDLVGLGYEVVAATAPPLPLSFADSSFDGVVSLFTPTLDGGPTATALIEEIHRVLKRGGRLLLSVPFGRAAQSSPHRVPSGAMLDRLLSSFRRVETVFAVCEKGAWSFSTDAAHAETVDSGQPGSAVTLVAAEKN